MMAKNEGYKNHDIVMQYAQDIISGKKIACKETKEMCIRFINDLKNPDYDFRPKDAEFVIGMIQATIVHQKGQALDGTPLRGKPFLLEPFQKFIIYNLLGFYHAGTLLRRFKEAFILMARKNGKTPFIAALSWALALLERMSGSTIYIVASVLKQSKQAFDFLKFNLEKMGAAEQFRVLNNNQEHSISGNFGGGHLHIEALAANPDSQDSLNSNIQILDELHAYKSAKQYNVIKESGKAYRNKLCIGITTAGDNMNSFCYNRMKYCQKVVAGTVKDEQYFVFIAKADEDEAGNVDYTNPIEHEKANPNYGVSISPDEILNEALQAQNDPQSRKDFLAKSLNIYTSAINSYFDINVFKTSNSHHHWTVEDLAKLPITWYGGADLSELHDLTAAALYGTYKDVDIVITHAFFPRAIAHTKADEDNIPLFGWEDDGWLTMSNTPTVDINDVVKWFKAMRDKGFNIKQVGYDRKFAHEFKLAMLKARFKMIDQAQYGWAKTPGFRRVERQVINGKFYYLGSEAFEYCVDNVMTIEDSEDAIKYKKVQPHARIDLFDACIFGCLRMINDLESSQVAGDYFGD